MARTLLIVAAALVLILAAAFAGASLVVPCDDRWHFILAPDDCAWRAWC